MQADVTVRELMDREYVGVSGADDLLETVGLLLEEEAEVAVVLRGSELVGVVTERDVLSLLVEGSDPASAAVRDAMTQDVSTISPEEPLEAAADRLSGRSSRRLVVADGDEPLGLITEGDLLATRTHRTATDRRMEAAGTDTGTRSKPAGAAADSGTEADASFEDQSICEACGALTRDLAAFNGQLLCVDCRDM